MFCQDNYTSLSCTLPLFFLPRFSLWGCYHLHLSSHWWCHAPGAFQSFSTFTDELALGCKNNPSVCCHNVHQSIAVWLCYTSLWSSYSHLRYFRYVFPFVFSLPFDKECFCYPWFVHRTFLLWQLVFRFIHSWLHRIKIIRIFRWIKESEFDFSGNFWVTLLPIYPFHVFYLLSRKPESKFEFDNYRVIVSTATCTWFSPCIPSRFFFLKLHHDIIYLVSADTTSGFAKATVSLRGFWNIVLHEKELFTCHQLTSYAELTLRLPDPWRTKSGCTGKLPILSLKSPMRNTPSLRLTFFRTFSISL